MAKYNKDVNVKSDKESEKKQLRILKNRDDELPFSRELWEE